MSTSRPEQATPDPTREDPRPHGASSRRAATIFDDARVAPSSPGSEGDSTTTVATAQADSTAAGATAKPAATRTPARRPVRPDPSRADRLLAPLHYARAAHPRQAVLTALAVGGAALLAGKEPREAGLALATVLVGQVVLGWHNDLVDQDADAAHERTGKPIAQGRIDPGNVWFALCCAILLLIPLAVSNGVVAGGCYVASVAVGMIGNVALRTGPLSFLPWALVFAAYPFFLSYGSWGGTEAGAPPEPALVGLSALLGVGVHVLTALWGLVADHEDGWTYLPLKAGLALGATTLLVVTLVYLAAVTAALVLVGHQLGLAR